MVRHCFSLLSYTLLTLAVLVSSGCRTPALLTVAGLSTTAPSPTSTHESDEVLLRQLQAVNVDQTLQTAIADFQTAEAARRASDPNSVSKYAQAALACWPYLRSTDTTSTVTKQHQVAWDVYHESVERMLDVAWENGTFDPQRGILFTRSDGSPAFIQVKHHGFPWKQEDFNEVHVIHDPVDAKLARYWSDPGLGVPMVIVRRRQKKEEFLGPAIPYSATGILRPHGPVLPVSYLADVTAESRGISPQATLMPKSSASKAEQSKSVFQNASHRSVENSRTETAISLPDPIAAGTTPPTIATLELYDPSRVMDVHYRDDNWQLQRDTSAPFGIALNEFHHHKYKSFLLPGKADEDAGLRMIEPYQRGKIPIVLVHGLLSDRATWVDLANDLRSSPWFNRNFQVWFFQYETGKPYISSALEMRTALQEAVRFCDPDLSDPTMQQMVLVGHSMGGLVSKLQITSSGTDLWDSIAVIPADQIRTSEEKHQQIRDLFFFEPLPFIKRAVFIGSPHQGSSLATSWIGRLGSALVHPSKERVQSTKTILANNPGVFVEDVTRHVPTSVDLLRPDNPLLMATYTLPVNPEVRLHTIIGTGRTLRDGTPADGVVPIESARHPGTSSECRIDTTHTKLPDDEKTTEEIVRILGEHLRSLPLNAVTTNPAAVSSASQPAASVMLTR